MVRAALVAVALLLCFTADAADNYGLGGGRRGGGSGSIPVETPEIPDPTGSAVDWDSSFAIYADDGCCTAATCQENGTALQRWTPEALGSLANGYYSFGKPEQNPAGAFPYVDDIESSCFELSAPSTSGKFTNEAIDAWVAAVNAPVAADPVGYWEDRADFITVHQLIAQHPSLPPFPASAVTRMNGFGSGVERSWSTFVGFFDADPMRAADQARCGANGQTCDWANCRNASNTFVANDAWDAGHVGCNQARAGRTLSALLDHLEPGLGEAAVYQVYSRGGSSQQLWYPVAAIADLTDPSYRAWRVAYERLVIDEHGAHGLSAQHKVHQYRKSDGTGDEQLYVDMGDGIGGMDSTACAGATGTVDTLAELDAGDCDSHSGPARKANGDTYGYSAYAHGYAALSRDRVAAGIPYLMRSASPYWWEGCTTMNADFTGSGCADDYDLASTPSVNENALLREIAMRSEILNIDRQGKPADGSSGGLGSGGGSGFSCASLEALINSAPTHPTRFECIDSEAPLRTTPAIWGGIETNPQTLTVASPAASDVDVVMIATSTQETAVAPAVVHIDLTSSTDATPGARPFHDLACRVDCGIERAGKTPGTWAITGYSYDTPTEGLVAGCYYTEAGTYTPRAFCMNPAGDSDVAEATVVVATADSTFLTTATTCVSIDGVFTGGWCPAGATTVQRADGDFDAVLASIGVGAKKRILFKAGEVGWTASATTTLGAASASPGLLIAAPGAKPVVTLNNGVHPPRAVRGWGVWGFRFTSDTAASTADLWLVNDESRLNYGEIEFDAASGGCVSISTGGTDHPDLYGIVNFKCRPISGASPTTSPEVTAAFLRGRRSVLMGWDFDSGNVYSFVRWVFFDRVVFSDSLVADSEQGRNVIQLRGPTVSGWPGSGAPGRMMVFGRNILRQSDNGNLSGCSGNGALVRTCAESLCTTTMTGTSIEGDILLSNNLLTIEAGGVCAPNFGSGVFWVDGWPDVTIRNNVVDLQGMASTAGTDRLTLMAMTNPSGPTVERVHTYGNTVYRDDVSPRNFQVCYSSNLGSGHRCDYNLIDLPNASGSITATNGTGFTSATGNVTNTNAAASAAFYAGGAPPAQGLTTVLDFDLAAGASPRNESAAIVDGLLRDAIGRSRGESAAAGAMEGW